MDVKIVWVALLMLSGCGAGDERFTGTVTTERGQCGPGFDDQGKATATLMVRGKKVEFAPSNGVVLLNGNVDDAGHVRAGDSAPGADKKPFMQVFEGDRKGDEVVGRFATPRCRATVALNRR